MKQTVNPKFRPHAIPTAFFKASLFHLLVCLYAGLYPTSSFGQRGGHSPLELEKGDRVVYLGNALMENERAFNFLEFRLTRHWPERSITFRNLGWSGDNVFGEARSYYTSPPSPYELLISQLTEAKPTHVFLAYGGMEAINGSDGLDDFEDGLETLLAKIAELGAETILISPIPQFGGATPEIIAERNQNLKLYSERMRKVAQSNNLRFVDVIEPMNKFSEKTLLSENGVHLTALGYNTLATIIEAELGLQPNLLEISINAIDGTVDSAVPVTAFTHDTKDRVIAFNITPTMLPVPAPSDYLTGGERSLAVKGLKKGIYSLEINGQLVATASATDWEKGQNLRSGGDLDQAKYLQQLLNKKDEVFFYQYRPLNRTYIIGFREYEQGRHVNDLKDFDVVLTWLQGQITAAKVPLKMHYRLFPVR
nr:GDSL family lipase [Cytophagales bacterium]